MVFDINDFDETLPGPFEWDVKRLAASLVVAGREQRLHEEAVPEDHARRRRRATAPRCGRSPPSRSSTCGTRTSTSKRLVAEFKSTLSAHKLKRRTRPTSRQRTSCWPKRTLATACRQSSKLTTVTDGRRRIRSDPPLVVPLDELTGFDIDTLVGSDPQHCSRPIATRSNRTGGDCSMHFTLTDVAHKVVGVGSVGTRAWILLLESGVDGDALLLQAKQAEASVLADYAGESEYAQPGRARRRRTASDAGLERHLPRAGSAPSQPAEGPRTTTCGNSGTGSSPPLIEEMNPRSMDVYARLCGWTLARAHARSGDRIAIAAYLGNSTKFDNARR